MSLLRVVFILISAAAIGATAYVGYFGAGGASTDLDRSVRTGSGGVFVGAGRVK